MERKSRGQEEQPGGLTGNAAGEDNSTSVSGLQTSQMEWQASWGSAGNTQQGNRDDDMEFLRQLFQFEDHEVRMIYEYFQDDLMYIVPNLSPQSLLTKLKSQNMPNVEKYKALENDRKSLARTLLQDIYYGGRDAVIRLWVSLFKLRKSHDSSGLNAVLDDLHHRGNTLVEEIQLDKNGHHLPPELTAVQYCHMKHLCEKTEKLIERKPSGCHQGEEQFPIHARYVNLIIVSTNHFKQRSENELIETGQKQETYLKKIQIELQRILPNKLFRWCHQSILLPRMVMVIGVPGVGKTTLMQKFVYDWTMGDIYQRFSFVFFFKFRELNRLDNISLETLILHQYPHLEQQLGNIFQDPEKLLFIFDGLDESLHTLDFTSRHLCSNPIQPEPCGQIVVSLVRKSLLNGCSVLMTSRPTRLASIDCSVFQRIVEISGFFPEERQMYFENFFSNSELAEKAFTYVKQKETLYTFCYLPSYCWIICTVLSRSFQPTSSDQPGPLLPKTVTQLFAIFIANILSNHSLHKSGAQQLLRSIGWLAEHGVMNHRIIFDDRDLESFYVDKTSKLLSSFLMESEEPVSYSFLHLTVQEFFSALVHYVDYSPERLQKSLKDAESYPDGRGEIFLRFLCGLTDNSTRSILTEYLDSKADQASRDVISWVRDIITEEQSLKESGDKNSLRKMYYLYETRSKALVLESLKSCRLFDLSDVHMSAVDCTVLAFILKTCSHIEALCLSDCSLNDEELERLTPGLCNLQSPRLSGTDEHGIFYQLASVIKNNQSLKTLHLPGNNLSDFDVRELMEALSSADCRIEELNLSSNALQDTSCIHLASVIRKHRSLKILDLSFNKLLGPHFGDLMMALSTADCRLEDLRLGCTSLPDTACTQLASVIRNNWSLKILRLSDNHLFGPYFSDLMEALSSPDCRIEELRLDSTDLPDTACTQLASVIRNNQYLKELDLSDNHLFGPHFSDLMEALSRPDCRIKKLGLSSNDLPDTACTQLASVIRNNQYLKELDLSGNHLFGPHFSDLMEALSRPDCRIKKLGLEDNEEEEKYEIRKLKELKPNLKISNAAAIKAAGYF
ncbi:NACHT, LRR and PYD domains-containing protein 3-like isoform 2-T2 [Anomaloglossus baeobatrachus]